MILKFTLILLATFLLTSCLRKIAGNSIDIDDVDSVLISKREHSGIPDSTKRLTKNSIRSFVEKWNNSSTVEIWKFLPQYALTVYIKNGKPRSFRTTGKFIKENNDWCANFKDTTYFDKLWVGKNAITNQRLK